MLYSNVCECRVLILLPDSFNCWRSARLYKDLKRISVAERWGCALVFPPNVNTVLSQFLECSVFIGYCAARSESVIVNCVTFGWQFCGKNECRWIFGNVQYVTELIFKLLIQTATHKRMFHNHFCKFLATAIYESETRNATRSAWQPISQLVFLSTLGSICNHSPFLYHFQHTQITSQGVHFDQKLPQKTAHSDPNLNFLLLPVAHPLVSLLPVPADLLWLTVWPGL